MTDLEYMRMAYHLALKGKGRTSPNPMVGCVIVKDSKIVGRGWHHYCGGPHAEVLALDEAKRSAKGATLYVTLEPCCHYGRTPPCADQIIQSQVKRVVIGVKDPNPLINGKAIRQLRRAGIQVGINYLQNELNRLNEAFNKFITTQKPFVVAKIAQTLDGKIATRRGQSKWITSKKTRDLTHRLRDEFDVILTGVDTVIQDDPRLNGVQKKTLRKVVVDSNLRIPLNAKLFKTHRSANCIIVTTPKAKISKINYLKERGALILVGPKGEAGVDLKWLMQELGRMGIASLLIEGGSKLIGNALKENLVDKVLIFVAPKILGDQEAVSSIRGLNIERIDRAYHLKFHQVSLLEDDLMIEAYPKSNFR